jgi:tetratricopeptide (TPR) repeat protein
MVVFNDLNLSSLVTILQQTNSTEYILWFVGAEIAFWILFSMILVQFLPSKYKKHKKEIFLFFVVVNIGLLLIGIVLTLIMMLFGLSWATNRVSRPSYETIYFEEQASAFPMVYSEFHEGILALESDHQDEITTDEKIKSLKILYDSHAQGNIGRIQHFLSDSSDETRLYAFALISTFEKSLNKQIKELQKKINYAHSNESIERYSFELAQVYWQFIFHGVASEQLTGFYTQKIEKILNTIRSNRSAFVLLGKIKIFNKEYSQAEAYFNKAIELGVPKEAMFTFFAEIKYGQGKFNEIAQYILPEEFDIDLRLKPLIHVWRGS